LKLSLSVSALVPERYARHPLLASSAFRTFFLADIFVAVAERYFALTFAWWLLASPENGGARLGLLMGLESTPTLVLGLLVGPIIDRLPKQRLMLASTVVQTLVLGAVALWLLNGALSFPKLCVAAVMLGCLVPVFEGAANAALPEVVAADQLEAAAAIQASTLEFSNIIAAALSAGVIAAFSFEATVVVNAALYALGAVFVFRVKLVERPREPTTVSYLADLKAGIRYVFTHRGLAAFVGVYIGKLLLVVPLLVIIPMLVKSVLGDRVGWVGVLETGFSVGSIVTALVLSFRRSHGRLYSMYAGALALLGVLMLLLTLIEHPYGMLPNVIAMGGCVAVLLSLSNILFQEAVSNNYKGRFFGIIETLAAGATPLGYAVVALSSGSAGVTGVLVVSGAGLLVLAIVVLLIPRIE
jgi:hypothetical protein